VNISAEGGFYTNENVFDFCTKLGQQKSWGELNLVFSNRKLEFKVIFEDEAKRELLEILDI